MVRFGDNPKVVGRPEDRSQSSQLEFFGLRRQRYTAMMVNNKQTIVRVFIPISFELAHREISQFRLRKRIR